MLTQSSIIEADDHVGKYQVRDKSSMEEFPSQWMDNMLLHWVKLDLDLVLFLSTFQHARYAVNRLTIAFN